jgi:hypothetical protein
VKVTANVRDFGARGDGITDDSAAFRAALEGAEPGAILVPRGLYRLDRPVAIRRSGIVLRGENAAGSVILAGTVPGDCTIRNQGPPNCAPYHGAAMLRIEGEVRGQRLARVTGAARRGERRLPVDAGSAIGAGQVVRLRMRNPDDNSLGCHLYADGGCLNAERRAWFGGRIVDWVTGVASVTDGTLTLARPLRLDVRPAWEPEIWSFTASVQESGIEELTIRFAGAPYAGHNHEQGHYAILLQDAYHCWVRDVTIVDADRGIEVRGGHNTIRGITLLAENRHPVATAGVLASGHYALSAGGPRTQDNLFEDIRLDTVFVHNLTVQSFANGNVFSRIRSRAGHLDHHGGAPYENLFTEIRLLDGAQGLFLSGGRREDEPGGARTTLWNLDYAGGIDLDDPRSARVPGLNLVGVRGLAGEPAAATLDSTWIESWTGSRTRPRNLYEAQRDARLGR